MFHVSHLMCYILLTLRRRDLTENGIIGGHQPAVSAYPVELTLLRLAGQIKNRNTKTRLTFLSLWYQEIAS